MAKDRIEKTLVVFDEEQVRQLFGLAQQDDDEEIQRFMLKVFIRKVEAILRHRCGGKP